MSVSNLAFGSTVSGTTFTSSANTSVSNATIVETGTINATGNGLATVTVDGCTIKDQGNTPTCNSSTTSNFTVMAPDLIVSSGHTGNFKAGDTADTYTLTASNNGNANTDTSGVTVQDMLPPGFTATAISGTGWTCTRQHQFDGP